MNLKISLLAFLILSAYPLFAQQCGYDGYYLFAVNPHLQNSNKKIGGLKMYLVDENNTPLTNTKTVSINNSWELVKDSFYFWDNAKKQAGDYTKPFIRRNFNRVGNNYIVAFPFKSHLLNNPLEYPIYKVKVEEQIINNITIREQFFYLPVNKAISICQHHLYENYDGQAPVETVDRKNFKPIDITINKEPQAEDVEEIKSLTYAIRFTYQANTNPGEEITEYSISSAKVYHTQTGKLHQEIWIDSKSKSINKEIDDIVEFIDFYNRGIEEAKDFSVLIDSWRDLDYKVMKSKTNFYVFNLSIKKYQLDTALSNYNDVFYYYPLKKMRRYDYVMTAISQIANTYQFENNKWVLIDKSETFFKPVPPKIKYVPKNCIFLKEQSHTLPLQAVTGNNATKQIKDTFWLYNGCDEKVMITKVESNTRDFFSINQTLLPKQYTPLVFNGLLQNNSFDFTINNFSCNLTLSDNHILSFGVMVPITGNNSLVHYRTDSTINYAISKHQNTRFNTAIFAHPNGSIRAKGLIQDADTSLKVGTWRFFKEGAWGIDEVIYSKEILASALDENHAGQHINFKINVLENGIWQQPVIDVINTQQRFFITEKTDSIMAYTDTTSYCFALNYKKIPANKAIQFFLLKPNERTMKIGYYQMPFSVLKDQYTIVPDYSKFISKNRTSYQIIDSILASLIKIYPRIATVLVSKHQRGIDLGSLSFDEKKKVLMQLTNDSTIAFVCQLFTVMNKNRIAFCNNKIYAEINNEDLEDFKKKAAELGYTNISADIGSNRYWLTHESKLIDEGFFESYEKLTKNPLVQSAHFNSYFEPEPDNYIKY